MCSSQCSAGTAACRLRFSAAGVLQETFESVLELASRLHLNCLTQKCEDMLASTEFELTTGSSETDLHSVVRWAHIAQKHHLVVCCPNKLYYSHLCYQIPPVAAFHDNDVLTLYLHLQALQLRCEQFMCNNFHKLVNDPLLQVSTHCCAWCYCLLFLVYPQLDPQSSIVCWCLQTLTRHSLLSMLRAQSAMLSVYQQHAIVPETWGLTR